MLWDEHNIVIERLNSITITEANLLQHAVHGILSKKSREHFGKMIKSMNVETRPFGEDLPEQLLPTGYEEE